MKKKFIVVATPTLGQVSIEWASILRSLAWPLNTGYANIFMVDAVGGEIAETRNACVATAFSNEDDATEISHIFWLDDDVLCTRMALIQLLSHNRDIAAGCYFTRCDPAEPLIFPGRGAGTSPFVPNQLIEAWGCGMGLTLVKMDVYRRMAAELDLGRDKYNHVQFYKTCGPNDATVEDGILWAGGTEDLYMLDKASKLGINPLVDTSPYAFGFHFDKTTRQGYPIRQWEQHRLGQKLTWPDQSEEVLTGKA